MNETTAGLCACGCGQLTTITPATNNRRGWVKGQPRRYIRGHHRRKAYDGPTSWASKADFLAAHLDPRLARRFWAKVATDGPVPPHRPELGSCWLWTGAKGMNGYGRFSVGPAAVRQTFNAHRVAVALDGCIPDDEQAVCHHCDNPRCVRPDHLFVGTMAENMQDMLAKGRGKKPADTCSRGHSLTDETNIYVYTYGPHTQRVCIICHRERGRAYHQAQKKKEAA